MGREAQELKRDSRVEAACRQEFAKVVRFETHHCLNLQAMGQEYLEVRSKSGQRCCLSFWWW
jgi:hypothetical protein